MTKIVFPESVERELAQQEQQPQPLQGKINAAETSVTSEIIERQISERELKAKQAAIQSTTSKFYQPESPFSPEYRSKSSEIEERLKRIQQRFEQLKIKEDKRNSEIQRQAWLKYHNLSKPTIQDFKRPLTSFFLFASAIYITMQYTWFALEREDYVSKRQEEQLQLVDSLNQSLLNQKQVLDQYNEEIKSKKWWKWF